ncbi:glycosyltransferase family 2 protein [Paenibacillus roseipurpureus]|uniref:4,4'-diaponeurosporenoate glycosyltransferase n=1 Tax=Paenibacillus roseopurpureus TaxID=2918901 RepID=A0AA96LNL7_9BACL|nr:glycosyltransferase family 2 protein [Paenibacillus sp. MBLB1832]WNR45317.1 glycosyltransferase family 2 protein [Paenibacillus sp. MBLB1832]
MTVSEEINLIIGSLALLVGLLMFWTFPIIKTTEKNGQLFPLLSIIIPARNEAGRISPLLRSLQEQHYQSFEVLIVDDHSTDQTANIARSFGAKVLQNKAVDSGSGKSTACWHGAQHAKGQWLLFLDADTSFTDADSLFKILGFYHRKGARGILSLQPYHTVHRLYENLSAIFNVIVFVGMNVFTIWGSAFKAAGSFGPSIVCNKKDYFLAGGHHKILGAVMDDLALGQAFMDNNLPVYCMGGSGVITFRMYPEGLKSLVEGWCKSFAVGSKSTHPVVMAMIILWITGGFMSTAALISSIMVFNISGMASSGLLYAAYALQTLRLARRCGNFNRWIFLFYPLLFLFFSAIHLYSLFRAHVLHSVSWKGRKIDV